MKRQDCKTAGIYNAVIFNMYDNTGLFVKLEFFIIVLFCSSAYLHYLCSNLY